MNKYKDLYPLNSFESEEKYHDPAKKITKYY